GRTANEALRRENHFWRHKQNPKRYRLEAGIFDQADTCLDVGILGADGLRTSSHSARFRFKRRKWNERYQGNFAGWWSRDALVSGGVRQAQSPGIDWRQVILGVVGVSPAVAGCSPVCYVHRLSFRSDREQVRRWHTMEHINRVFKRREATWNGRRSETGSALRRRRR